MDHICSSKLYVFICVCVCVCVCSFMAYISVIMGQILIKLDWRSLKCWKFGLIDIILKIHCSLGFCAMRLHSQSHHSVGLCALLMHSAKLECQTYIPYVSLGVPRSLYIKLHADWSKPMVASGAYTQTLSPSLLYRCFLIFAKGQNSVAKGNNNYIVPRLWHKQQRSCSTFEQWNIEPRDMGGIIIVRKMRKIEKV